MQSIRSRLLTWVLGALGAGSLLLVAATYVLTLDEMNEVFDEHLRQVALAVAANRPSLDRSPAKAPSAFPHAGDEPDDYDFLTVTWTPEGKLISSSDPGVALPFSERSGASQVWAKGELWHVHTVVNGDLVVQAAQRAASRDELVADVSWPLIGMLLALMAAIAALLLLAMRRGLAPLEDTARDVASRSARSLQPIAGNGTPIELRPLVSAINDLIQRLAQAFARQRQFVADAAHELRTPVTALRLQLQLLERTLEPAERELAIAELRAGIQRSQRLIEQLLDLSRVEPEVAEDRIENVDLGELVRDVVAQRSAEARRRHIDLGAEAGADAVVPGDRHQMEVLLSNLVDNALHYTPGGGTVDAVATRIDGRAALMVVDDGPGIAPDERARVFDRFYRCAGTRHNLDTLGSGLGLAIVKAIAERHGAAVSLHTASMGHGLEVRVIFAAAPAPG